MWGVLFLVPFAAPWIGFGVLGLPCRAKVAVACGMEPDGLEARKDEFSALLKEVVESLEAKKASQPSRL